MPIAASMERFNSGGQSIPVEIFHPTSTARSPAVLILHGTFGLLPPYRPAIVSFAEALADTGIVAAIPHYFERTGTAAGASAFAEIGRHLGMWKTTCADALTFARTHAGVDPGSLSLIGFSLGGHLALDLAMARPAGTGLKCVVDFFGPTRAPQLTGHRALLPPVLIHHGSDDTLVPVEDSLALVKELRADGKVEGLGYTFIEYAGQGHGFTGADLDASRVATVSFLRAAV